MNISKTISEININNIANLAAAKCFIIQLLNLVEDQSKNIDDLKKQNQTLRDENNRLKGEQGKPDIRPQSNEKKKGSKDFSSEGDRKKRKKSKKKKKRKKRNSVKIDREVICKLDKDSLPPDALFKGYTSNIVQDIRIITDNIKFLKETYYSPSLGKTFIAPMPDGYVGEFGPNIRSYIISFNHDWKMTEPNIVRFFESHDIMISDSSVSRFLTKDHENFHQEYNDIVEAGLLSTEYQQMDDTGARVNGKNYVTHILCNMFFTAYFTRKKKDRLTVLDILSLGKLMFVFYEDSYELMTKMKLSNRSLENLKDYKPQLSMSREEVDAMFKELFPEEKKHQTSRRIILEAAGITYYQQLENAVQLLLTDDAPQFKQITKLLALCWIHDGRHYKKLEPVIDMHREKLDDFSEKYWAYYHKLLDYKENPESCVAEQLSEEFDNLFSTKTGYDQLDKRIEKTKSKKENLLMVLKYPDIPLHNNVSELGARTQARRRDISFQTKNDEGTKAKDAFMTIIETAKKLGVNSFDYVRDRVTKKFEMPSLASLIQAQTKKLCVIEYNIS